MDLVPFACEDVRKRTLKYSECMAFRFQGLGMVTSEYIDVDENGKMINCSPLSYKIPNVRSIPRKFNVTLVQEDSVVTPVYSAKVKTLIWL